MMAFKKWLIKKLGGVTKEYHQDFKNSCEEFARQFLVAREGATCFGYGEIKGGSLEAPLTILGSQFSCQQSHLKELLVAPWVSDLLIDGCNFSGKPISTLEWYPPLFYFNNTYARSYPRHTC